MDITIQREALLKPLQAISGVVEKKQTVAILANVLLAIKEGHLLLTGTDLEIELIGQVPIQSLSQAGSTTVSARKLFEICRTLAEGSILRLSLEKNNLIVRTQEGFFVLNTLPPQDFPNLDDSVYPIQFTMNQLQFKNLLARTYFAMGLQDVRHYLNGALLDINNGVIKCVAADGHRLAFTSIEDSRLENINARVILPRKSVLELMRLLGDEENMEINVCINDTRVRAITKDYIFTTKLINAQYPDYKRLIPMGSWVATGNREIIKQALTRVSILSNEKYRGVRFQLDENKLRISANNADQEQAEEDISLDYKGHPLEVGFNVGYLLDIISAIPTKSIRCAFTDPNSGVRIESAESDHSLYVVMPMRL